MSEAARLRSHIERLDAEIAHHKNRAKWHGRQLKNASVARAQALAALARLQPATTAGAEGEGVLHGQQVHAQS